MWKSRTGQEPPPAFWADFVANVNALFPSAALDKATLDELYSLVVDEWRNGTQLHLIVRQLCSCDGHTVVPSEGARRRLGKHRGIARPPEGATPGQAFGLSALRDPAPLARILARKALVEARIRSESQKKPNEQRQRRLDSLQDELRQLASQVGDYRRDAYWTTPQQQAEGASYDTPTIAPTPTSDDSASRSKSRAPRKKSARVQRMQRELPPARPTVTESDLDPLDEDLAERFVNEIAKRS